MYTKYPFLDGTPGITIRRLSIARYLRTCATALSQCEIFWMTQVWDLDMLRVTVRTGYAVGWNQQLLPVRTDSCHQLASSR